VGVRRPQDLLARFTLKVQRDGRNFTVDVAADGEGLISHAGAALLGEVADPFGLTRDFSRALVGVRDRRGRHNPGRVIRDLAVMLADGGDCLSDLRAVCDQEPLFGPVASDSTAFRLIDRIASEPARLAGLPAARAAVRERSWGLGVRPERIVIDIDATLVNGHTEKEGAAVNYRSGWVSPDARVSRRDSRGARRRAARRWRARALRSSADRCSRPRARATTRRRGL
jgi:hypothetical protein